MFHNIIYIVFMSKLGACSKARMDAYEGKSLATSELEPLVETYKTIIDLVEEYVVNEEKRLPDIKRYIHGCNMEHEVAKKDASKYIGNPLNAFAIIKTLTIDLDEVKKSIQTGMDNKENVTSLLDSQDEKLPTTNDVEQAAIGMRRLMEAYKLDIKELVEGNINGVAYSLPMTADDCYMLSKIYYYYDHLSDAESWMLEAMQKQKLEEQDDFQKTKLDSWLSLLANIQNELDIELRNKMSETYADEDNLQFVKLFVSNKMEEMYSLCRDEIQVSHSITKRLTCFLMSNRPFLRLAPIKTEQLYIKPDVFMFYDIISDEDIELFKKMAKPELRRTEVNDFGKSIIRTGKGAWLADADLDILPKISKRITLFTGLSMDSAEDYHIVNYGIGGHYTPHYDHFASKGDHPIERIATVLFYLSDVEQGGATVFPRLDLSVFPIKKAALFWFNLFPSGEGDTDTLHSACPVCYEMDQSILPSVHYVVSYE